MTGKAVPQNNPARRGSQAAPRGVSSKLTAPSFFMLSEPLSFLHLHLIPPEETAGRPHAASPSLHPAPVSRPEQRSPRRPPHRRPSPPPPVLRDPSYPPLPTLSLIHISEPTRLRRISYAVFC